MKEFIKNMQKEVDKLKELTENKPKKLRQFDAPSFSQETLNNVFINLAGERVMDADLDIDALSKEELRDYLRAARYFLTE